MLPGLRLVLVAPRLTGAGAAGRSHLSAGPTDQLRAAGCAPCCESRVAYLAVLAASRCVAEDHSTTSPATSAADELHEPSYALRSNITNALVYQQYGFTKAFETVSCRHLQHLVKRSAKHRLRQRRESWPRLGGLAGRRPNRLRSRMPRVPQVQHATHLRKASTPGYDLQASKRRGVQSAKHNEPNRERYSLYVNSSWPFSTRLDTDTGHRAHALRCRMWLQAAALTHHTMMGAAVKYNIPAAIICLRQAEFPNRVMRTWKGV